MSSADPLSSPYDNPRGFRALWFGQSISAFGDAFAMVAAPLLVLQATGSVAKMGLLTATAGIGHIVAGLVSGAIVDRVDRRRLMIACDLARVVSALSVPLVFHLFGPRLWVLFVAMLVSTIFGNAFQVAAITAVPSLVEKDAISNANGRLHASFAFMQMLGPMLAGFVCQRFGAVSAFTVDAATFAISAVSLLGVRLRPRARADRATVRTLANAVDELLAGVRFLFAHPLLRPITVILGLTSIFVAGRLDLFVYFVKHDLHRTDGDVGRIFALGAAGAVVGGMVAARLRARIGFTASWLGAGLLLGFATIASAYAPTAGLLVAMFAVGGACDAIRGINSMSLRQEVTPDALLGRVTAAFWSLIGVLGPLGAALLTALAARTDTRFALVVCGAGIASITASGLFTRVATRAARSHGRRAPI